MLDHDWNDALLDDLRRQMDPLADSVAAAIIEGGRRDAINALMREITQNDAALPEALPAPVHEYFEDTAALPAWADPERILLGEQLFMR